MSLVTQSKRLWRNLAGVAALTAPLALAPLSSANAYHNEYRADRYDNSYHGGDYCPDGYDRSYYRNYRTYHRRYSNYCNCDRDSSYGRRAYYRDQWYWDNGRYDSYWRYRDSRWRDRYDRSTYDYWD